jgi:hypothetical protein
MTTHRGIWVILVALLAMLCIVPMVNAAIITIDTTNTANWDLSQMTPEGNCSYQLSGSEIIFDMYPDELNYCFLGVQLWDFHNYGDLTNVSGYEIQYKIYDAGIADSGDNDFYSSGSWNNGVDVVDWWDIVNQTTPTDWVDESHFGYDFYDINSETHGGISFSVLAEYGAWYKIGVKDFIIYTNGSLPEEPPASITNLANITSTCEQVNFTWTNPADSDFNGTEYWWNDVQGTNLTSTTTYKLFTGLTGGNTYTFSTKTFDLTGNVNATFVNMSATATSCANTTPTPTPTPGSSDYCIPPTGTNVTIDHNGNWYNITLNTAPQCFTWYDAGYGDVVGYPCEIPSVNISYSSVSYGNTEDNSGVIILIAATVCGAVVGMVMFGRRRE